MAPTDTRLNAMLVQAHRTLSKAQPGSPTHTSATSALHKLRLEACRRTGNLGVQHARAVFPNY